MMTTDSNGSKNAIPVYAATVSIALILGIWFASHMATIGWGLPNPLSFAKDAVPMDPRRTALDFMKADLYRYPPLQYLLWDAVAPASSPGSDITAGQYIALSSVRLQRFRWTTALMTLGTALIIFGIAWYIMRMGSWSCVPAGLFLLNPTSLFYSHTTNMDQPYLFWVALSFVAWYRANVVERATTGRQALGNAVFGMAAAAAVCTKDQAAALYVVPLVGYLAVPGLVKMPRWERLLALAPAAAGFGVVASTIYSVAGGWETFHNHVAWITGPGSKDWRQFDTDAVGRARLLAKSTADAVRALDWPLAVSGGAVLCVGAIRSDRVSLRTVGFGAAVLVSYQLCFVQVAGFAYPRFFLPVVPIACILVGYAACRMARQRDHRGAWTAGLCMILQLAVSGELMVALAFDTRMELARWCLAASDKAAGKDKVVALDSCVIGKKYRFDDAEVVAVKAIRDWATTDFGYIAGTRSIAVTPLFLALSDPRIVVLRQVSSDKQGILEQNGYERIHNILPRRPILPTLFTSYQPPAFTIYHYTGLSRTAPQQLSSSTPIDEQLMTLQHCFRPENQTAILQRFGAIADDFAAPDLAASEIYPETIALAGLGYRSCDRHQSAYEAFRFLAEQFPESRYQRYFETIFPEAARQILK